MSAPPVNPLRRARHARRRKSGTSVRLTRRGRILTVVLMLVAVLSGAAVTADALRPAAGPPQPSAEQRPDAPPGQGDAAQAQASAGGPTTGPASPTAKPSGKSTAKAAPSPAAASASPTPQARPAKPMPVSPPVSITIPVIRVKAPLTTVGLDARGWIAAPSVTEKNLGAWYEGSSTPGAEGTSVIVGHVDGKSGPAVFYKLGSLKKGARIHVARKDGSTAVFTVYGIEVFSKKTFPAERVYGGSGVPELRLITCGGTYNGKAGYNGNVVVFARLAPPD
ncbi:class F sortase [Yinghuangia soli]|uniref:Class F sortase n=1 Tax=Yinghuangia soli TaxID=2908204 RepID=A0AA41Q6Y1_9ACTN|nr:class F sortase [Yinghuangia soli]MCF2532070.1 class F sortase [Yinghuangia soli]